MKETILESIAQRFDCFISSLPGLTAEKAFVDFLCGIPAEAYSPEEWSYGLSYLYRRQIRLETPEAVAECLREIRKENPITVE